jgi:hypothetical protein
MQNRGEKGEKDMQNRGEKDMQNSACRTAADRTRLAAAALELSPSCQAPEFRGAPRKSATPLTGCVIICTVCGSPRRSARGYRSHPPN